MRSLPNILWFLCNKLNEFSNTGALMLDAIYHMTIKIILKLQFRH